jgi:hypothetical protein
MSQPPATGTSSRMETAASITNIMSWLNRLEEMMHALTTKVGDVDQQQQVCGIALVLLEQGQVNPDANNQTPSAWDGANSGAVGERTSDDHSVAPPPHAKPRDPCHPTTTTMLKRMIRTTTTSYRRTTSWIFLSLTGPTIC